MFDKNKNKKTIYIINSDKNNVESLSSSQSQITTTSPSSISCPNPNFEVIYKITWSMNARKREEFFYLLNKIDFKKPIPSSFQQLEYSRKRKIQQSIQQKRQISQ